jgi:hypothetical protein
MDVTGILKLKQETQQIKDSFKKREFVLTIDQTSQYPQHITFQLTQDKTSIIDGYNVGEEIKVSFNLRGREWTSPQGDVKYFNTIDAWRIERVQNQKATTTSSPAANTADVNPATAIVSDFSKTTADDDLPF